MEAVVEEFMSAASQAQGDSNEPSILQISLDGFMSAAATCQVRMTASCACPPSPALTYIAPSEIL